MAKFIQIKDPDTGENVYPISIGGSSDTLDHAALINRHAADQHPMSAITGLESALASKQPVGDYLKDGDVPSWAMEEMKPTYSNSEVGLSNVANERQYSANNPPPYPVTSVNGKTGAVTITVPDSLSDLAADSTHRTVTDTEKASWNTKLDASELPTAINTALAQAKESGEFDGQDGKSAYQYAVEGGYTGTEGEFASKMADEEFKLTDTLIKQIALAARPVGSLYWSKDPTSPAELFGGRWEQIKDVFILTVGDTYTAGTTGGAATVSLTAEQNGQHSHTLWTANGSSNPSEWGGTHLKRSLSAYFNNATEGMMNSSGSGEPHNNMPPYETAYCWRRLPDDTAE